MSTEENKALMRRHFEEVLSQGNLDIIDEIYAADFVEQTPTVEIRREDYKQVVTMYRTAFTLISHCNFFLLSYPSARSNEGTNDIGNMGV